MCLPSLRGANGSRECAPDDRLRDEAIHALSFRDGPKDQTRNLEIPGSMLRIAPERQLPDGFAETFWPAFRPG